jgi:hypothetical protein
MDETFYSEEAYLMNYDPLWMMFFFIVGTLCGWGLKTQRSAPSTKTEVSP